MIARILMFAVCLLAAWLIWRALRGFVDRREADPEVLRHREPEPPALPDPGSAQARAAAARSDHPAGVARNERDDLRKDSREDETGH